MALALNNLKRVDMPLNKERKERSLNVKQSYLIQFSLAYVHTLVVFDPLTGPYQMLPLRTRADVVAIAMKGYSAFPKAQSLLEPH